MKKTILNLGKALNKAEQKEIFGGTVGDVGLPDVGPGDNCINTINSPKCDCADAGGRWNNECKRCDMDIYFAAPNCGKMHLP